MKFNEEEWKKDQSRDLDIFFTTAQFYLRKIFIERDVHDKCWLTMIVIKTHDHILKFSSVFRVVV